MPEARTLEPVCGARRRKPCAFSARAQAVIALALGLSGCSGGASDAKPPTAALSTSVAAEGELRRLVGAFSRGSRAERMALEAPLQSLKRRYPTDAAGRVAEVLLAWIALDQGDPAVALARARVVEQSAGRGSLADLARAVQGAALRRQGRADDALALLAPLTSKLIDGWARSLFNEELVESAIAARRWDQALQAIGVWLREAAPEEIATVRSLVDGALDRIPAEELSAWMRRPRDQRAASADDEQGLRRILAQRLARAAVARKDADLAHLLLTTAGPLLGDQSDAVAALATGVSRARVEARTVGLMISLRDARTRRRGADIAEGVAFGLGLPGSAARLVSRDDKGSAARVDEALAALAADGAAIVIAGADEAEATRAATFAESRRIPVILLRPPAPGTLPGGGGRFTFVLGLDPADVEDALIAALAARGAPPLAILADEPILPRPARPEVSVVRGCSEAAAPWKPLGVGGVVISAQPECARAGIVNAAPLHIRIAVGLESEVSALPPGSLAATAGLFPIALGDAPKPLAAWAKTHPAPPTFWTALGRDAAVLAWAGVQALPAEGTEEPNEVAARRASAAAALAMAEAPLWTSEAHGFGGARSLPRSLGVREIAR